MALTVEQKKQLITHINSWVTNIDQYYQAIVQNTTQVALHDRDTAGISDQFKSALRRIEDGDAPPELVEVLAKLPKLANFKNIIALIEAVKKAESLKKAGG